MTNPILNIFKSRIYTALLLVFIVMCIGILGYRFLADYSWIDAVYMTVITVTTVGFGETNPLDTPSKIFTIFLILSSLVILGYAISLITEFIISKNNFQDLKQRKMQNRVDNLKNHIIICGYGRNGRQAAIKLNSYDKPFVIIEQDKELIEKFGDNKTLFVQGNANEDETLLSAGLKKAKTLICALPDDADNLFVVLSARQLNPDLTIISRASRETSYKKLKLAGANNVILPDRIGGDHMASLVVLPGLIEFVDNLSYVGSKNVNIEEVAVEKLYDAKKECTIRDLDLRQETGCTVIGFKKPDGEYIVNPEANTKLVAGSKIIVLGRPEQVMKLNSTYDIN